MHHFSSRSYRDSIKEEVEKLMQKIDNKPIQKNWFINIYKKIAKKFINFFAIFK